MNYRDLVTNPFRNFIGNGKYLLGVNFSVRTKEWTGCPVFALFSETAEGRRQQTRRWLTKLRCRDWFFSWTQACKWRRSLLPTVLIIVRIGGSWLLEIYKKDIFTRAWPNPLTSSFLEQSSDRLQGAPSCWYSNEHVMFTNFYKARVWIWPFVTAD